MTSQPVTFVTAGVGDLQALVQLDEELFDEEVRYGPETFLANILRPTVDVRLALLPEGVVGVIIVSYEEATDPLLVTVNVASNHQRHGIGSLLLNEAMRLAHGQGGARLVLHVSTENSGAKIFYERHGFEIVERLTPYYRDGSDAWRMVVAL